MLTEQPGEVQSTSFICAYCGEENPTFVDPSQGRDQQYVEDCQVCCRPNELVITYDEWTQQYHIQARPENPDG